MIHLSPRSTLFPYTTLFRSLVSALPYQALADPQGFREMLVRLGCISRKPCGSARDRKSTRLNSSHMSISYAVFCLKKKIIDDLRGRIALKLILSNLMVVMRS